MKSETLWFVSVAVFIFTLVVGGFVVVKPALAQVSTSTDPLIGESVSSEPSSPTAASSPDQSSPTTTESTMTEATLPAAEQSAASPEPGQTETPSAQTATEARPEGLAEVHIIGTKYIDYFTDGTATYSFPGDPKIHAHIAEKDAPIPTHEGMTWVHSTGQYLYDTQSGDLEEGQYAVQPNGSIIAKNRPMQSATSSPAMSGDSATSSAEQ